MPNQPLQQTGAAVRFCASTSLLRPLLLTCVVRVQEAGWRC